LTGESEPVPKDPAPRSGSITLAERRNMVFSGIAAARGSGRVVVTAVSEVVEVLVFGVAPAVAAVPEGLSTILTLVLALRVRHMPASEPSSSTLVGGDARLDVRDLL
jgi:P-type Ca2+ transporter type 2C